MRALARRDRLEREIETALDPGRFISDRGSYSFVADLELVDADLAALVGSEPARAVALYAAFLAGCYETIPTAIGAVETKLQVGSDYDVSANAGVQRPAARTHRWAGSRSNDAGSKPPAFLSSA